MVEQPSTVAFTQGRGWEYVRRWRGRKEAANGLFHQLISAGWNVVSVEEQGPMCSIEATLGANDGMSASEEVPFVKWERQNGRTEKTIYEHPRLVAAFLPDEIQTLNAAVDSKQPFDATEFPFIEDLAEDWFNLIVSGQAVFPVFNSTVRMTMTVSGRFEKATFIDPAGQQYVDRNVGKVLSRAQMISIEGAPSWVLKTPVVPSSLPFAARAGFQKDEPLIQQEANNKWSVTIDWHEGVFAELSNDFVAT